jgi:hypothetical protein
MLHTLKFIVPFQSIKRELYKVRAVQTSSKKFFFAFFLHHLIEFELLITKIYFLALVNVSFRSKNTKYSKVVVFREKHIFLKMCKILFRSFFQLVKVIFSDSASKTKYKKVIESTLDPKLYWWWRFELCRL